MSWCGIGYAGEILSRGHSNVISVQSEQNWKVIKTRENEIEKVQGRRIQKIQFWGISQKQSVETV